MLYKANISLILLVNFLYVFRSIGVTFRIENSIYVFSFIIIFINILGIVSSTKKYYVNNISVYILVGAVVTLYSSLLNPIVVGIVGFAVIFLNLFLWNSFFKNINKEKLSDLFIKFVKINVYFGCITAIFGLYQYFIDPSIMGLALHDIYGSHELMESGRFIRRVTGLLGSPQNYALYIAITTSLVSYISVSRTKRILIYLLLLSGGLVSGSRAYSLFLVIVVLSTFTLNWIMKAQNMNRMIKRILVFFIVLVIIIIIFNSNFSNNTVNRMVNLINDWPALEIYKHHLDTLDLTTFWLGRGLGVNERVVVQLLGAKYYESVGSYVNSYESYLLSVLMQMGFVGVIAFISIYLKSIYRSFQHKDTLYISILISIFVNIAVTPSFNGFAMSFLVWPIILYPLYLRGSKTSVELKQENLKLEVGWKQ